MEFKADHVIHVLQTTPWTLGRYQALSAGPTSWIRYLGGISEAYYMAGAVTNMQSVLEADSSPVNESFTALLQFGSSAASWSFLSIWLVVTTQANTTSLRYISTALTFACLKVLSHPVQIRPGHQL